MVSIPRPGGNFTPAPAGTHHAVCNGLIHIGSHENKFDDSGRLREQVIIRWLLPEEVDDNGIPCEISKFYTWSMHQRASLRQDLETWRGKAFADDDFGEGGFQIEDLLGACCTLTVTHKQVGDRTRAVVSAVGPIMRGNKARMALNPPGLFFWMVPEDGLDRDAFDRVPEGLQKIIKDSPEYAAITGGPVAASHSGSTPAGESVELDDEIPF